MLSATLLLAACEKKEYYVPNQTIVTDLARNMWTRNADGSCTALIDLPELDGYLQQRGGILVYISEDQGGTYEQIPQVYQDRSYSFAAVQGQLRIDLESRAGLSVVSVPSIVTVKIILVDSDY